MEPCRKSPWFPSDLLNDPNDTGIWSCEASQEDRKAEASSSFAGRAPSSAGEGSSHTSGPVQNEGFSYETSYISKDIHKRESTLFDFDEICGSFDACLTHPIPHDCGRGKPLPMEDVYFS